MFDFLFKKQEVPIAKVEPIAKVVPVIDEHKNESIEDKRIDCFRNLSLNQMNTRDLIKVYKKFSSDENKIKEIRDLFNQEYALIYDRCNEIMKPQ